MRANARELLIDRLREYSADRGPLHLQRLIPGYDIRAHVVGEEIFAVRIDGGPAVDYRTDRHARYSAVTLPGELKALLVEATRAQGMVFSGWDLKVDADERLWCLESNPMPGYSFYDGYVGGTSPRPSCDSYGSNPAISAFPADGSITGGDAMR